MTNDLFRDLLEGRIPAARKRIKPGIYFLPKLKDPTRPTMKELAKGVNISHVVTIADWDSWAKDHPVWDKPEPTDPRARALWAKQQQGHGPAVTPLRVRGRTTHYKEKR